MTDPAGVPPLDRSALLGALDRHAVRFVLVGGLAAQAYGATRVTKDVDICAEWSTGNLSRLADALTELQARLKIGEGSIETLEVEIDARTIHKIEVGAWRTAAGDVDVLLGIPASSRWDLARYEQRSRWTPHTSRSTATASSSPHSTRSSARRRWRTGRRTGRRSKSSARSGRRASDERLL